MPDGTRAGCCLRSGCGIIGGMKNLQVFVNGKPVPYSLGTIQVRDKRWRWQPKWTLRFWYRERDETFVELEHAATADTPIVFLYEFGQ